jgi:predicted AAA+ superfamily ATPase
MNTDQQIIQTLVHESSDNLKRLSFLVPRTAQFPNAINKIKVAVGMRRTGKTYFLYFYILQLLAQNIPSTRILYLNFEDDRLFPLSMKKLASLVDSFYSLYPENHENKCYLFLDEIQNVPDWAVVIRRFYDSKNCEIFLTGSSAKLLSKEIATSLRGRSLATEIWPYSFDEFLQAKKISIEQALFSQEIKDKLTQLFHLYLQEGGFPEVIHYSPEIRQRTLQEYVDVVIYRDIIERHQLSNSTVLKYMIMFMIHNIAAPFSINKFYNDVKSQGYKVGKDNLYDYLRYIEDAYLIFSIPLYAKSIRKVQSNPKKIYAIDTGLIRALTLDYVNDFGRLFENIVYLDLRRKGYSVSYYLTQDRYEIDFVVENRIGEKKLYQVVWDTSDPHTLEREKRALLQAQAELNLPGEIITLNSYLKKEIIL